MKIFTALVKKDLKGYFDQPTGYILLVVFIGVISFLFFRGLDTSREASLRPLFEVMALPWILPVFVAAATMRLVAEEQRDGTLEILLTQPLRGWSVLLAKFVSGFLFVGTGILFTAVIPIALSTAGDLDSGAIAAQYIGTFFLTASFVAIGVFSSSLTQNQIVSFMVALALMVALMLAGSPIITLAVPPGIAALIQDLSPATHYTSILRGIIDLRDVLYFIALVSAFLSGSYLLIRSKSISHRSPLYRNLQLGVAGLVVISLLVGWFGGIIEGRLDLTEKRLHTLGPATKDVLGSLDDLLTIKFFYTEDLPPQANLVKRDLEDFLDAVQEQGKGNIRVLTRKTDPEDEDSVREARENLIRPIQFNRQSEGKLQIEVGYLGLGMTYINQREIIAVVRTTDGLEFAIASAVFRMLQKDPQTVAFHTNSEDPALRFEEGGEPDFRTIRTALTAQTQVEESREGREGQMQMGGIDALVVTGPMRDLPGILFTEWDTYFAEGGEAVFLMDPVLTDTQNFRGVLNPFNLDWYLSQYGVRVNKDMVFDTRSHESLTVPDIFQPVIVPYEYWVRIPQADARVSGGGDVRRIPVGQLRGPDQSHRAFRADRGRHNPDRDNRVRGGRHGLPEPLSPGPPSVRPARGRARSQDAGRRHNRHEMSAGRVGVRAGPGQALPHNRRRRFRLDKRGLGDPGPGPHRDDEQLGGLAHAGRRAGRDTGQGTHRPHPPVRLGDP